MIGVDWGTSSFRAFMLHDGKAVARIATARGIMGVTHGDFAGTLRSAIAGWLAAGERHILMSGMIGSRQGWVEAAYLPCPAAPGAIAEAVTKVPFEDGDVRIVPGLSALDAAGQPEVMRGEETQIIGAGATGLICLPGSHSKWARVATDGTITGFETYFSGEAFAALRGATILGRMMDEAPHDCAAFDQGLAHSAAPGHLLHHLFAVRTRGLMGQLASTSSASYLSGLLIGHEIRAAMPAHSEVTLLGNATLCALYAHAIARCGGSATIGPEDCAAYGLARIGARVPWT
jgi:2-dehydro-3-deoxygalactonokinase